MPLKTVAQYFESLKDNRVLYINGEKVTDIVDHVDAAGYRAEARRCRHYGKQALPELTLKVRSLLLVAQCEEERGNDHGVLQPVGALFRPAGG